MLVVACGLIPLTAGSSWACSCAAPTLKGAALDRQIARSEPLIFTAEVVKVTETPQRFEYGVTVTEALKGVTSPRHTLVSALGGGTCGMRLHEGVRLLIHGDEPRIAACGGTYAGTARFIETHARVIRAAVKTPGQILPSPTSLLPGQPTAAVPSDSDGIPVALWVGLGVLVLAAAGGFAVRSARR
ncbi:MAG: hypothetical protein QOJ92_637 [Frankiales bacterium]|nr:hypothetical protein [Frankiales bacterium]